MLTIDMEFHGQGEKGSKTSSNFVKEMVARKCESI